MNRPRQVLLVDPISSGVGYINRLISRDILFDVIFTTGIHAFVNQHDAIVTELEHAGRSVHWLSATDDSVERFVQESEVAPRIDYVICGSEVGVVVAERLRELLDIRPRNAGSVDRRIDKFQAQQALLNLGLACIPSHLVESSADASKLSSSMTFPVVLKPTNSGGSDGVCIASTREELVDAAEHTLRRENAMGRANDSLVVQPFVQGTEYVVDAYVANGELNFASVGRYAKAIVDGTPAYRSFTWLDYIAVPQFENLQEYVQQVVVEALGIRVGCVHVELFWTCNEWVLVEVGMRAHGGGHPEFTKQLIGTSQVDLEVEFAATGVLNPARPPVLKQLGQVLFLHVDRPRVVAAELSELLDKEEWILHYETPLRAGHIAEPPHTLFDSFGVGIVVFTANDEVQLADRAHHLWQVFESVLRD